MKDSNFSHDFFDKWTEQSAYILGFWYADGCIMINKYKKRDCCYAYKKFSICNTDKQILYDISKIIGVTPYTEPKEDGRKLIYRISVNSNKFFDFCYALVGTVDKTNSIHFPNIPHDYLRHFIRGYFDGDGSIYLKTYKSRHGKRIVNLSSSFSASKESWVMLDELKQLLMNIILTGNKKVTQQTYKSGSSSRLIFNQYDTMLLCEWMYKDATIFMKRKKKIWDDFDKDKLRDSQKYFSNKV